MARAEVFAGGILTGPCFNCGREKGQAVEVRTEDGRVGWRGCTLCWPREAARNLDTVRAMMRRAVQGAPVETAEQPAGNAQIGRIRRLAQERSIHPFHLRNYLRKHCDGCEKVEDLSPEQAEAVLNWLIDLPMAASS